MGDARADDLLLLSRDVARGSRQLARWRVALAKEGSAEGADDPLESVRRIAGKSTWDAIGSLVPSAADAPLREALQRWVYALAQARIGLTDEVDLEGQAAAARVPFAGEADRLVSYREAWRGVVRARTARESARWLEAAAAAAPSVAAVARRAASRRLEVARRFGFEHPWEGVLACPPTALIDAAGRWLDATEDLSRADWKETLGVEIGPPAVLHAAVGRDAGEGWPAQPLGRWLAETLHEAARGLPLALPRLPVPLGASSFVRALYAFGVALRAAAAPASMPFALAQAPAFVGAHRFGFVFGALASSAEWQARVLGLSGRVARGQARMLARSALLEARLSAARILLGDDADLAPRVRFQELGARLFGAELDARLNGAWPPARPDEPARFAALLEAPVLLDDLRERFDSDWYRNPRAAAHLRALGAVSAHEPVDAAALSSLVDSLARRFERALG